MKRFGRWSFSYYCLVWLKDAAAVCLLLIKFFFPIAGEISVTVQAPWGKSEGGGFMKIVGMDGLLKELPCGTALLAARAHHREDPFVPLAAPLRTAALREPLIDHRMTNRLLRQIVRRRNIPVE